MYDMLHKMFPDMPIQLNYKVPTEDTKIFEGGLKFYEFDVSSIQPILLQSSLLH
jgi:hypothetical protein